VDGEQHCIDDASRAIEFFHPLNQINQLLFRIFPETERSPATRAACAQSGGVS
jgi:hypothetical protein